jgi:hypothetical protein
VVLLVVLLLCLTVFVCACVPLPLLLLLLLQCAVLPRQPHATATLCASHQQGVPGV